MRLPALILAAATVAKAMDAPPSPSPAATPAPRVVVLRADRLHLGTGEVLEPGELLVEDGAVKALGTSVEAPEGTERWTFREVTPWLVDPLVAAPLGRGESGRLDAALLTAKDARPSGGPDLASLRAAGHFAFLLVPAGVGLSGRAATIGTDAADGSAAPILVDAAALVHALPEDIEGSAARAAARAAVADQLEDASAWKEKRDEDASKPLPPARRREAVGARKSRTRKPPPPQDAQEIVLSAAEKKLPLLVPLARAADAAAVLDVMRARSLTAVLAGCRGCGAVARELAASQAVVILDPLHAPPSEAHGIAPDPALGARLAEAGARLAVSGGGGFPEGPQQLRAAAAALVGGGVPRPVAVAAMTGRAAEAAGVAKDVIIARDRPARVLAWTGDPLEPWSRVERALEPEDFRAPRAEAAP